ncbi:hypothetical protein EEL40_13990 [Muribaculaceae bacterium Isolate-083 (Janvier)]|nr:hypothetical protein EEL37_13355 [Muribaculaceae bacterium Isolate-077 (Janvier)]ROS94261.1 hypothetical protein EEL40_13990 [Muribaculaceae bacterium Isolate-083 (Janvier)]ROS96696.1 hypothetical protein EEL41_13355 [Muribaculaceae bacterium Isolate-084 (Janvier)]
MLLIFGEIWVKAFFCMDKTAKERHPFAEIAKQLKRIADYMERHPATKYIIHVNEGATISGGVQDIAKDITNAPGVEVEANGKDSIAAENITTDNTESFNNNAEEAIKNLTAAIKK